MGLSNANITGLFVAAGLSVGGFAAPVVAGPLTDAHDKVISDHIRIVAIADNMEKNSADCLNQNSTLQDCRRGLAGARFVINQTVAAFRAECAQLDSVRAVTEDDAKTKRHDQDICALNEKFFADAAKRAETAAAQFKITMADGGGSYAAHHPSNGKPTSLFPSGMPQPPNSVPGN